MRSLLAVGSLGILGCADRAPLPASPAPFVLVTLDTFRADHLGRIGGWSEPVETPNLDALADRGTLYSAGDRARSADRAVARHAPHGRAAGVARRDHESLAARSPDGRERAPCRRMANGRVRLELRAWPGTPGSTPGSRPTTTCSASASACRRSSERSLRARRQSDAATARSRPAIAWLAGGTTHSFAVDLHLYDPHAPYDPPPPWDARYDATASDAPGNPEQVRASMAGRGWTNFLVPQDLRSAVARYAGEVSWTDAVVGGLVAALPPDATIVVVADHGESLVEHGEFLGHGRTLYEPSLRVFAIAVGPGIGHGVVDDPIPLDAIGRALVPLATTARGAPDAERGSDLGLHHGRAQRGERRSRSRPAVRRVRRTHEVDRGTVAGPRRHSSGARTRGRPTTSRARTRPPPRSWSRHRKSCARATRRRTRAGQRGARAGVHRMNW
jgi:hypothetical protein